MDKADVLIAAASKYGSTGEIAKVIGDELNKLGIGVNVERVQDVDSVEPYNFVILGSAIYAGRWLKPARQFVDKFAEELAKRQTWLFSSGPIGDPLLPKGDKAVQLDSIIAMTKAKDHKIFTGKLDKSQLNFAERAIIAAVHGKEGDFRNWSDVKSWAQTVANQIKKQVL